MVKSRQFKSSVEPSRVSVAPLRTIKPSAKADKLADNKTMKKNTKALQKTGLLMIASPCGKVASSLFVAYDAKCCGIRKKRIIRTIKF